MGNGNDDMKVIPGGFGKDVNLDKMKEITRQLRESIIQQVEIMQLLARLDKAYFDALVSEGFPPVQALELTKAKVQGRT
jgi:hypothetical protein